MLVIKAAIFGICGVLLGVCLKNLKNEYAIMINLFVLIILSYYTISKITYVIGDLRLIVDTMLLKYPFIDLIIKMIGISYVCELSSGICKDAGYSAISTQIIILGKVSIVAIGTSVIISFVNILEQYLG